MQTDHAPRAITKPERDRLLATVERYRALRRLADATIDECVSLTGSPEGAVIDLLDGRGPIRCDLRDFLTSERITVSL